MLTALNTPWGPHELKSNSPENWESIDPPRVLEKPSEKVSAVNVEWHKLGGVFVDNGTCEAFSLSLVRLMMFFILSFWFRRCSLLLHHIGLLYSQERPKCLQALQPGLPSSHFFRRNRHVKQPVRDLRCIFEGVCFDADVFGPDIFVDVLLEGVALVVDIVNIKERLKKY